MELAFLIIHFGVLKKYACFIILFSTYFLTEKYPMLCSFEYIACFIQVQTIFLNIFVSRVIVT